MLDSNTTYYWNFEECVSNRFDDTCAEATAFSDNKGLYNVTN
ncbi:hypothetical protein OAS73_02355 [Luminiphilus sp.]|nr:hypothetical protein [Luminiphilus sp.]